MRFVSARTCRPSAAGWRGSTAAGAVAVVVIVLAAVAVVNNAPLQPDLDPNRPLEPLNLKGPANGDANQDNEFGPDDSFVLLSTGSQLKIHLLKKDQFGRVVTSGKSYSLKSDEFDGDKSLKEAILSDELSDDYLLTKWLKKKYEQKTKGGRASILPKRKFLPLASNETPELQEESDDLDEADESVGYGQNSSTWQRPYISDVDYFVDNSKRFCEPQTNVAKCLLIVWLDKRNQVIRMGSFGLKQTGVGGNGGDGRGEGQAEFESKKAGRSQGSTKVILLREFSPVFGRGPQAEPKHLESDCRYTSDTQFSSISMDKQSGVLYVLGIDRFGLTIVHSIELSPNFAHVFLDRCGDSSAYKSCVDKREQKHLQVGRTNAQGKWVFYLEEDVGSAMRTVAAKISGGFKSIQYNYMAPSIWNTAEDEANVVALALDPPSYTLYRLSEGNRIYKHRVDSRGYKLVGQLSQRPSLKSVDSMQVDGDFLYLSDPVKRAILIYELPKESEYYKQAPREEILGSLIEPATHRVLLVETPTITSFRVFNSANYIELSDYNTGVARRDHLQAYGNLRVLASLGGFRCLTRIRDERISRSLSLSMSIAYVAFVLGGLLLVMLKANKNQSDAEADEKLPA